MDGKGLLMVLRKLPPRFLSPKMMRAGRWPSRIVIDGSGFAVVDVGRLDLLDQRREIHTPALGTPKR